MAALAIEYKVEVEVVLFHSILGSMLAIAHMRSWIRLKFNLAPFSIIVGKLKNLYATTRVKLLPYRIIRARNVLTSR